jgi:long-subunit fatty acid transport protein
MMTSGFQSREQRFEGVRGRAPRARPSSFAHRNELAAALAMAAFFASLGWARVTWANAEPPILYDTRSASMGGAGAALIDSPAAMFHNTAGVGEVESMAFSATFTPYFIQLRYPWLDAQGDPSTTASKRSLGPLAFVGLTHRVHDKVATGFGAFLTAGLGAKYESLAALGNRDTEMGILAGELQLPVAFQVTDALTIGAAYRVSFAVHQMKMPMPDAQDPTQLVDTEMSTSGWNFSGVQIGARYKANNHVRFGASYRAPVSITTKGETKVAGTTVDRNTEVDYDLPNSLKIGTAFSLFDDKVTIAVDFNYWMYSLSHREYGWRDSVGLNLGAEYWLTDTIPLRLGGFAVRSATTKKAAGPFVPSEGPTLGFTLGTGLRLSSWEVDLGAGYGRASSKIKVPDPAGGTFPQRHEFSHDAFVGSISVTHRM